MVEADREECGAGTAPPPSNRLRAPAHETAVLEEAVVQANPGLWKPSRAVGIREGLRETYPPVQTEGIGMDGFSE